MSDSAPPPPRLALLVCDTPIQAVLDLAGGYPSMLTALLRKAAELSGFSDTLEFVLDTYDVVDRMEYPPDDAHYDAIVISGSKWSVYENAESIKRLIAYTTNISVSKPSTKIIGICFGHQIVSLAFGGDCIPNHAGWEVGVYEVQHTDIGTHIFGTPVLNIQQIHRDHVPFVPKQFHLLGSTPITPIHGMVKFTSSYSHEASNTLPSVTDIHILTIEGHPEFTAPVLEVIVEARTAAGILDAATAEEARRRVNWRNDGVEVAKVIFRMLGVIS